MLPTKFQVNRPFCSGEEAKNRFSRLPGRRPSWIFDRNFFSYFWSTSHPHASYQVSSQFAFLYRRRSENRFSRWLPRRPSLISDRNDFSCVFINKSPWCFLPSYELFGPSVQEKKRKINSQHGRWVAATAAILDFRTTLAIFDVQVTPMLPTKFQVNWPFGSGEEAKNRFSRWPPRRPTSISDRNDFSCFWSTSHPMLTTELQVNWPELSSHKSIGLLI